MAGVFEIHVDKENPVFGRARLKPHDPSSVPRVGKTFLHKDPGLQPVRKVFGDVNRNTSLNRKLTDQGSASKKQSTGWNEHQLKQPSLTPVSTRNSGAQLEVLSEVAECVETEAPRSPHEDEDDDIEKMHIEPEPFDTYEDIWAVDFPIIPDSSDEDSSGDDSLLLDTPDSCFALETTASSWDIAERSEFDYVPLEVIPIEDIPLPPLDDSLPNNEDLYSSLP